MALRPFLGFPLLLHERRWGKEAALDSARHGAGGSQAHGGHRARGRACRGYVGAGAWWRVQLTQVRVGPWNAGRSAAAVATRDWQLSVGLACGQRWGRLWSGKPTAWVGQDGWQQRVLQRQQPNTHNGRWWPFWQRRVLGWVDSSCHPTQAPSMSWTFQQMSVPLCRSTLHCPAGHLLLLIDKLWSLWEDSVNGPCQNVVKF